MSENRLYDSQGIAYTHDSDGRVIREIDDVVFSRAVTVDAIGPRQSGRLTIPEGTIATVLSVLDSGLIDLECNLSESEFVCACAPSDAVRLHETIEEKNGSSIRLLKELTALTGGEAREVVQYALEGLAEESLVGANPPPLSPAHVAAIEEGLADFEAGRVIPHEQVVRQILAKFDTKVDPRG